MNALRPMISRSAAQSARSQMRTKASAAFPPRKDYSFKKEWLSDPSTYPIIAIMGTAMCFMTGMTVNALTYKGVYINPNNRAAVMKQISPEHKTGVMETFAEMRGGVKTEGLGIDHEKWAKEKAEYLRK